MIMLPGQALANLLLKTLTAKSKKNFSVDKVKGIVTQLAISQIVEIFNQYGPIVPVHEKWGIQVSPTEMGVGELLLRDMHYWQRSEKGTNVVSNIPTIVALFAFWCGRFGHMAKKEPDRAFLFSIEWDVYKQSYTDLDKSPDKNWPGMWKEFLPKFTVIGGEQKRESLLKKHPLSSTKRKTPFTPKEIKYMTSKTKTFKELVDLIIVSGDEDDIWLTQSDCDHMREAAVDFDYEKNYVQFYKQNAICTGIIASCFASPEKEKEKRDTREKYLFPKGHPGLTGVVRQGGNEDQDEGDGDGDQEVEHDSNEEGSGHGEQKKVGNQDHGKNTDDATSEENDPDISDAHVPGDSISDGETGQKGGAHGSEAAAAAGVAARTADTGVLIPTFKLTYTDQQLYSKLYRDHMGNVGKKINNKHRKDAATSALSGILRASCEKTAMIACVLACVEELKIKVSKNSADDPAGWASIEKKIKPFLAVSEGRVDSYQPNAKDLGGFLAKVCQSVLGLVKKCAKDQAIKSLSKSLFEDGDQLAGLLKEAGNKKGILKVAEDDAIDPPKDGNDEQSTQVVDMDVEQTHNKESAQDGNEVGESISTWSNVLTKLILSGELDPNSDSLEIEGLLTAWSWLPPDQEGLDNDDQE
jgi:hypothetical protein